jgi:Holliday junction resolvase
MQDVLIHLARPPFKQLFMHSKRLEVYRPAAPFDTVEAAHAMVSAAAEMNWKLDDVAAFAKRVQLVEYGLDAEDEFAALLAWLGRCPLVHRLDQHYYSSGNARRWRIPDLFALFHHRSEEFSALIEVKTSNKLRLTFDADYMANLYHYAELHKRPLLVAWKVRRLGMWILVDPCHFKALNGKRVLGLEDAIKNNLMSRLAGDFAVKLQERVCVCLESVEVGERRPTNDGYRPELQVESVQFFDGEGQRVAHLPKSITTALLVTAHEVDEIDGKRVRTRFGTNGGMAFSQLMLRATISQTIDGTQKPHWKHVAKQFDRYLSRRELHDDLKSQIGRFVHMVVYQHPRVWPTFLPAAWNDLSFDDP